TRERGEARGTLRSWRVPLRSPLLWAGGLWFGACGGEQGSPTGTEPAITLVVAPTTAVVQASAAIQLTGTVSNDLSNWAVTWVVVCAPAPCGTISPTTTASGAPATYTAPGTLPRTARQSPSRPPRSRTHLPQHPPPPFRSARSPGTTS